MKSYRPTEGCQSATSCRERRKQVENVMWMCQEEYVWRKKNVQLKCEVKIGLGCQCDGNHPGERSTMDACRIMPGVRASMKSCPRVGRALFRGYNRFFLVSFASILLCPVLPGFELGEQLWTNEFHHSSTVWISAGPKS